MIFLNRSVLVCPEPFIAASGEFAAARPSDQKDHTSEIGYLKKNCTSQRCDDCCADGMRDEIGNWSVGAQDQQQDATKDPEGQRPTPR